MDRIAKIREKFQGQGLDAFVFFKPVNRRYLSGFTGTSGFVVLTKEEKIIVTDFRYREQVKNEADGFTIIEQDDTPEKVLGKIVAEYGLKRIGLEKDYVTLVVYEALEENLSCGELIATDDPCIEARKIKGPEEILLLKEAVAIADEGFSHISKYLHAGLTEREIALELEFYMRRIGAEKCAFETIVASGLRSSLPHGVATDKVIRPGEMVTIDFGAVYKGYHSDITRTLFVGEPTKEQRNIYEKVLQAQTLALENIEPGMTCAQVDSLARDYLDRQGYGKNFGHGLGHGIGLNIHEEPRLSLKNETVLQPGMVVTVEPGVYIEGWGGVRIEDDVLLIAGGCEVLSKSPKTLSSMICNSLD